MDYIILRKAEYEDKWGLLECGDDAALKRELLNAIKSGDDVRVAVPIAYDLQVKVHAGELDIVQPKKSAKEKFAAGVKEEEKVETTEGRPSEDTDTGSKS